jgi:hypothetical protein
VYELANIKAYKVDQSGTYLNIFIPNRNLQESILTKQMSKCGVWLDDGRHINAEQRKKAYATIADISLHTGYLPEELKEWLKYLHIARTGSEYFSLSNCTMDMAREFINTIMDFAIENGIILSDLGINRTDDIGKYLYSCIKNRKCAVCGLNGEIHHWDAIGMGNDRKSYDDSENRKICLCRIHHTEAHKIGNADFEKKHKVYGIQVNT